MHGVRVERAKKRCKEQDRGKTGQKTLFCNRFLSKFHVIARKSQVMPYPIDIGGWRKVRAKFRNYWRYPRFGRFGRELSPPAAR